MDLNWIVNTASSFNFEIQKYYQNEPRFNGVYSRDNLPKTQFHKKNKGWGTILDEYSEIGTHWIALYPSNNVTYFDNFGVEHIPKKIRKFIANKNIQANTFGIQEHNSVMCGYFCIGFIDFMLKGKSLTDFTNIFSPNDLKRNDDIILNYFKNDWI